MPQESQESNVWQSFFAEMIREHPARVPLAFVSNIAAYVNLVTRNTREGEYPWRSTYISCVSGMPFGHRSFETREQAAWYASGGGQFHKVTSINEAREFIEKHFPESLQTPDEFIEQIAKSQSVPEFHGLKEVPAGIEHGGICIH